MYRFKENRNCVILSTLGFPLRGPQPLVYEQEISLFGLLTTCSVRNLRQRPFY